MKIVIVGAGGTGSYLVPLLQKQLGPEDQVVVVDGDKFETKNMDRQLFNPRDIGRNKAATMVKTYTSSRYTSGAVLSAVPEYLRDTVVFARENPGITAIISCADNHTARLACLRLADATGCKAVICGNEYECASASIYHPRYKGTGADPRVRYPDLVDDNGHDPTMPSCTGEVVEEEGNKQLALANFMSAAFGMALLYKWVIDPVDDRTLEDMQPFEMRWTSWGLSKSTSVADALEELKNLQKEQDEESN